MNLFFISSVSSSFTFCIGWQKLSESRPLVSSVTQNPTLRDACYTMGFCVASKAAILILLWDIFIGGICSIGRDYTFIILFMLIANANIDISFSVVALYSLTAIVYLFYPLSGFLADVYFGRFNTVFVSLTSFVCFSVAGFLSIMLCLLHTGIIFEFILHFFCYFCLFIAILSITSYKANSVQFGLDQLLEAPNQHQALFCSLG